MAPQIFSVADDQAGMTLAAVLRPRLPGKSWSEVRRLIEVRHVLVGNELCLDPARRLRAGDVVELRDVPAAKARPAETITIRHLDSSLVVVEKPAGLATTRHPAERDWSERRKALSPTLEDLVPPLIAAAEGRPTKRSLPRLRVVHRLDKETSGLLVFARTVPAERGLGKQFHGHTVMRRYLAIVPGKMGSQRIQSWLARNRGDGRRGSTAVPGQGKEAVTHVEEVERLPGYTLLSCRLETGRTHQIRIHLSELGHPICGERVYNRKPGQSPQPDESGAPRLALHAAELGFVHPVTGAAMHWTMALPGKLEKWIERLRGKK
jgi:23S rRNA pseudouridine1911/1915/1917 synthase